MIFIMSLFFGVLAASFALITEMMVYTVATLPLALPPAFSVALPENGFTLSGLLMLCGVALIEELSKLVFLRQYFRRFSPSIATTQKAWLIGTAFGIGFSLIEIVLASQDTMVPILNLVGIASIHIITSILFTLVLIRPKNTSITLIQMLTAATILHTIYNIAVSLISL